MITLSGKEVSAALKERMKEEVNSFKEKNFKIPHLAAVLVGNNPASESYVRNKVRMCEEVGFYSTLLQMPETVSEKHLLDVIYELNKNIEIDGYIVQLPLPSHISEHTITLAIDPLKDVDGFHPMNLGNMLLGHPTFLPATPSGILEIFKHFQILTSSKHCVIVGRSNIVGKPMASLMMQNNEPGNCTVTVAHSRTKNLKEICLQADILIAAIGKPHFITADMVKEGAVVIDVGINRIDDPNTKSGSRLVGDVDFDTVKDKVSAITPVPGGVGPMTVTALMLNTLIAAKRKHTL